MNTFLALSALFAVAVAAPQTFRTVQPQFQQTPSAFQQTQFRSVQPQLTQRFQQRPVIPVLSRIETRDDAGQFSLQYQSADGTVFTEQGTLKRTPDGRDNVLVKQGSYSFNTPEGVPVQVTYTADEQGFHPKSSSIPVAPAVPQPTF